MTENDLKVTRLCLKSMQNGKKRYNRNIFRRKSDTVVGMMRQKLVDDGSISTDGALYVRMYYVKLI